jgi:hypothetical protein
MQKHLHKYKTDLEISNETFLSNSYHTLLAMKPASNAEDGRSNMGT